MVMPVETKIIKLSKPLLVGENEVTELTMKEPTAGDMAFAEAEGKKGSVDHNIVLVATLCGIHQKFVKQMTGRDFSRALKVLGGFFDDDQETGENS